MAQASRFEHREMMDGLRSSDKDQQNRAFQGLLQAAQEPLEWAYEIWDELLRTLTDGDNRQRSIAAQVLCNLAKSDPKQRMLKDSSALLATRRNQR